MIRKALAVVVTFAVQTAAVMTPFMHAHLDDHATEHHGGARAIHSHFSSHSHSHATHHLPPVGLVIDDDDHDTPVYFPLFVAVGIRAFDLGTAAITFVELPAPAEAPAHRSILVVHGHDPPFQPSLPSRAPPAFLS